LEIGSLSSAVTTSYRLSTLSIGLLLTVFTELRLTTDRDGIWSGKGYYALKCVGNQNDTSEIPALTVINDNDQTESSIKLLLTYLIIQKGLQTDRQRSNSITNRTLQFKL